MSAKWRRYFAIVGVFFVVIMVNAILTRPTTDVEALEQQRVEQLMEAWKNKKFEN